MAKEPRNWFPEEDDVVYEVDPTPPPVAPNVDPPIEENIDQTWTRANREQSGDGRFTIADLLIVTTIAAVALTFLRLFRPAWVAAAFGILLLTGMGLMARGDGAIKSRLFNLGWWVTLLLYLTAVGVAIMQVK